MSGALHHRCRQAALLAASLILGCTLGCRGVAPENTAPAESADAAPVSAQQTGSTVRPRQAGSRHITTAGLPDSGAGEESPALARVAAMLRPIESIPVSR